MSSKSITKINTWYWLIAIQKEGTIGQETYGSVNIRETFGKVGSLGKFDKKES